MKTVLSLFVAVLVGVGGTLSYLGSDSPYLTEKRFWKARSLAQRVVANPDATPPLLFEKARGQFQDMIADYPENAALVKESLLSIGGLFIYEGKFQEARTFLAKAKGDYAEDDNFGARMQFLIGFSYERERDWRTALEVYRDLMESYPYSHIALQTPLYIARHDLKEDSQKGAESYGDAADYYRGLIEKHPKSLLAFFAMTYLVRGYQEQKMWDESLEAIRELVLTYPRALRPYMPMIEGISRRLAAPERARDIYESFVETYPNHRDARTLQKRIERLRRISRNVS